jgi:hypothetical protein
MIILKEYFNEDLVVNVMNCSNLPDVSYKMIMKNYLDCKGKVKYKQNCKFGRFYGTGLQSFKKDIRKYLSNGVYTDIDIVNCHPVILEQLFEKYDISVPEFLVDYNIDRKGIIEKYDLVDKLCVIKIINNEILYL